jgi:hypothetical protein
MNDQNVVQHMITFIEDKERQVQSSKFSSATQNKSDIVKSILDELESVTTNENQ